MSRTDEVLSDDSWSRVENETTEEEGRSVAKLIQKLEGNEFPKRVESTGSGGEDDSNDTDDNDNDGDDECEQEGEQIADPHTQDETIDMSVQHHENLQAQQEGAADGDHEDGDPSADVVVETVPISETVLDEPTPVTSPQPQMPKTGGDNTHTTERFVMGTIETPADETAFPTRRLAFPSSTARPSSAAAAEIPFKLALPPSFGKSPLPDSSTPEQDSGFCETIRERTRQRRAREDEAVSQLRVQVTRLQAALAAESKRRVSAIQHIHEQSIEAVSDMEKRIETQMQHEMESVHERLSRLEERMTVLEDRWKQDVGGLQEEISYTGKTLANKLSNLQQQSLVDQRSRQTREERLEQQMLQVAASYEERWQQERQHRITSIHSLQETMDSVHKHQESDVATFEGKLQNELRQLQVDVQSEMRDRHDADQEIVDALNRYSKQLQESLTAAAAGGALYY